MRLARSQLDHPVIGRNLTGETLAAASAGEPTLLVFLRHFG